MPIIVPMPSGESSDTTVRGVSCDASPVSLLPRWSSLGMYKVTRSGTVACAPQEPEGTAEAQAKAHDEMMEAQKGTGVGGAMGAVGMDAAGRREPTGPDSHLARMWLSSRQSITFRHASCHTICCRGFGGEKGPEDGPGGVQTPGGTRDEEGDAKDDFWSGWGDDDKDDDGDDGGDDGDGGGGGLAGFLGSILSQGDSD